MCASIGIKVEWLSNPLDPFVICFCWLFLDLTVHKVQYHSYHFELTHQ